VTSKKDVLKIEIYDRDEYGSDDLEGIVMVSAEELLDQERIDDWIGLTNESGDTEKGFLRIRVQLVWSKYELYNKNYNDSIEQAKRIQMDIEEVDRYLLIIEKPFGIILSGEVINLISSDLLNKGEEAVHYLSGSRNFLASSKIAKNESLAQRLDNVFSGVFSKIFF